MSKQVISEQRHISTDRITYDLTPNISIKKTVPVNKEDKSEKLKKELQDLKVKYLWMGLEDEISLIEYHFNSGIVQPTNKEVNEISDLIYRLEGDNLECLV